MRDDKDRRFQMDIDTIILKSGKKVYANRGILGITTYERGFGIGNQDIISGGYDDVIYLTEYDEKTQQGFIPTFTTTELYEIADMAIERWQQFKRDVANRKIPQKL